MKSNVTAIVSTRDRYFTTLPHVLVAIAQQTIVPDELIVYDDGQQKDLREDPLYTDIFKLLDNKGLEGKWKVNFGRRLGQVDNHNRSIEDAKTEFIWRLDDDNIPEPDVLEKLLKNMKPEVGAVAGLVIDPKMGLKESELASNKIEDIFLGLNQQWFKWETKEPWEVDHLYSSFIYRKEAAKQIGGYCLELSSKGHREETILTFSLKKAGWKLLIDPTVITWHFRFPTGGIRSDANQSMFSHDEQIFAKKLEEWKITPKQYKFMVIDAGLGDTLMFKSILPDLKKKYNNIVLAVCYRDVFKEDTDIKLISIAEAQMILGNLTEYNVYKWCWDRNWKTSLVDAYRGLYEI